MSFLRMASKCERMANEEVEAYFIARATLQGCSGSFPTSRRVSTAHSDQLVAPAERSDRTAMVTDAGRLQEKEDRAAVLRKMSVNGLQGLRE